MNEISVNIHTEKKYDTIVIPGGGINGFYILGSLEYLYQKELITELKTFIGTSIGSIISYLLIIGYTPIEIITTIQKNKYLEKLDNFSIQSFIDCRGAIDFIHINKIVEKLTLDKCGKLYTMKTLYETFEKTLVCVTYNMTKNETEYLDYKNNEDLPCLTALRMSCNLPIIFDRFKNNNCYYVDGGLSNNLALNIAHFYGKNVLGINLDIDNKELEDRPEEGIISYFMKLVRISIIQITKEKLNYYRDKMDIIDIKNNEKLEINFLSFNINIKTILDMFSQGYSLTRNKYEN